jgi:tetratricopeptide (TPR) repeat protein
VYRQLGRFELALQHNQHDLETSRALGTEHDVAVALGNRGQIYLESGELDQALRCLEEALHREEVVGNTWDAARHRAAVARVCHLKGERELALAHYARALPVLRAYGAPYYAVTPLLDAAELHVELGQRAEADRLTQEAAPLARTLGMEEAVRRSQALADRLATARAERGSARPLRGDGRVLVARPRSPMPG